MYTEGCQHKHLDFVSIILIDKIKLIIFVIYKISGSAMSEHKKEAISICFGKIRKLFLDELLGDRLIQCIAAILQEDYRINLS